jgi:hypothetical protein
MSTIKIEPNIRMAIDFDILTDRGKIVVAKRSPNNRHSYATIENGLLGWHLAEEGTLMKPCITADRLEVEQFIKAVVGAAREHGFIQDDKVEYLNGHIDALQDEIRFYRELISKFKGTIQSDTNIDKG